MIISRKKYEKKMCEMYDLGMQSLHDEAYDIFAMAGMMIETLSKISDKDKKKEILDKVQCVFAETCTLEKRASRLVYATRPNKGE